LALSRSPRSRQAWPAVDRSGPGATFGKSTSEHMGRLFDESSPETP
jgi:hypothetical protein